MLIKNKLYKKNKKNTKRVKKKGGIEKRITKKGFKL